MKSILISINPKWCELIANGEKTVEVRKTRPKLETPFKVYIYCTKNNRKHALHTYINSGNGRKEYGAIGHWRSGKDVVDVNSHLPAYRYNAYLAEGKVIGEFVCDNILDFTLDPYGHHEYFISDDDLEASCLTVGELWEYGKGKTLYGWHISDLVIYDKPRELSEFWKADKCAYSSKEGCTYKHHCFRSGQVKRCGETLTRPPQSWCYVEEVHNG